MMFDDIPNPYLDEKIEELNNIIQNLKTEHQLELSKVNILLKEKIENVSELEAEISKCHRSVGDRQHRDFVSLDFQNLEEEVNMKKEILRDLEPRFDEENDYVEEMKELIGRLEIEKTEAINASHSKDKQMNDLHQNIGLLENQIIILQMQVESKERELHDLEAKTRAMESNVQCESRSTSISDLTNYETTNQYLLSIINERESKIKKLKCKINYSKQNDLLHTRKESDAQQMFSEPFRNVNYAIDEINRITSNNFDSFEQCIHFVQILFEDSQKKKKSEFNKEDVYPSDNGYGSNPKILIEELRDRIYDLEQKSKFEDKRFQNKLRKKEEEIHELQEEINDALTKKPKDLRSELIIN